MKLSKLLPIVLGLMLFVVPAVAQNEACEGGFRQLDHTLGQLFKSCLLHLS